MVLAVLAWTGADPVEHVGTDVQAQCVYQKGVKFIADQVLCMFRPDIHMSNLSDGLLDGLGQGGSVYSGFLF